jgi:predicted transcriptional regulator
MNTIQLKTDLHRLIDQIEDNRLLQAVHVILAREVPQDHEVDWDSLSEARREAIQEGLDDIENGRVSSHKEVMQRIKSKYDL